MKIDSRTACMKYGITPYLLYEWKKNGLRCEIECEPLDDGCRVTLWYSEAAIQKRVKAWQREKNNKTN